MFLNGAAMPDGYSIYGHQVAGHRFETGDQGMLLDSDGKLLKPIQAPPRGEREVKFYKSVFECETSDQTILKLRQFLPTFYGVKHVALPQLSQKDNYIVLENLTRRFCKPCILDVKVGKCITDHEATEDKKERSIRKYPQQELFGFRILGMKIYNKSNKDFNFYDKSFGKNLKTHEDVLSALLTLSEGNSLFHAKKSLISNSNDLLFLGLEEYFCQEQHGKEHIEEIIEHLRKIKVWALEQRLFKLYSSSVLIIYEGDQTLYNASYSAEEHVQSNSYMSENTAEHKITNTDSLQNTRNTFQAHSSSEPPLVLRSECSQFVNTKSSLVKCKNQHTCMERNMEVQMPKVSVHLVDFAHTYLGQFSKPDDNYLYGLDNLIHYFEQLIR